MSLFKARECWLTQCGNDEEFDSESIFVKSLNSETDYIIVGSFNGLLRIFNPSLTKDEDGRIEGYKPTDLIIERQLAHPILQISKGRLVSGNQILQLALLHPRSVGVYSLVTKTGNVEYGNQSNVLLVYEHSLKRSASKLIIGPFGGSKTRDFICVQSLDGMLTFFEQENFAFCCFLPDFLLPGPIVYLKTTDCFITCGANWQIESYRYKRLSEIGQNSNQNDMDGKKFEPDWSYNIGENVLDIQVVQMTVNEHCIAILGERNMYCLNESGNLLYMKKFDFSPCCFHAYFMGTINKMMVLVVSETSTLLIYENATLQWSARLSLLPVAVSRGWFSGVRGALVFLSEDGGLQVCYLGTEPILFTAPPIVNKQLDFTKTEEELGRLNKIIRDSRTSDVAVTNATTERELLVTYHISPHLEPCSYPQKSPTPNQELQMCTISIDLLPNAPFQEAQVVLQVKPPLRVEPQVHFLYNLEDRARVTSHVYQEDGLEVTSLEVKVVVSHITRIGVPRVILKSGRLPLKLVMSGCAPLKEGSCKVTLNIDHSAPALASLFGEYVGEHSLSLSSNAAGFVNVLGAGSPVTILSAKSSSRYRLQSDSMASLNIMVQELTTRLYKHFESTSDFQVKHNSVIPTTQLLECLDRHFIKRLEVVEIQNELNDLASQFRLVQKRLISKFKDKNPTPLKNLDLLMLETHKDIIDNSDRLVKASDELKRLQCELGCVLQLILLLIKFSGVPEEIYKKVSSVFITPITNFDNQGWEDVIEACLNHLLRTVLAKSDKDRLKQGQNTLNKMKDVTKFKKHISQVIDRMAKDGALLESQNSEEQDDAEELDDAETLNKQLGSKIAENTVRIKSAVATKQKMVRIDDDNEDVMEKND